MNATAISSTAPFAIAFGNREVLSNSPIGAFIVKEYEILAKSNALELNDERHVSLRNKMMARSMAFAAELKDNGPDAGRFGLMIIAAIRDMAMGEDEPEPEPVVRKPEPAAPRPEPAAPKQESGPTKEGLDALKAYRRATRTRNSIQAVVFALIMIVGVPLALVQLAIFLLGVFWAFVGIFTLPEAISTGSFSDVMGHLAMTVVRCGLCWAAYAFTRLIQEAIKELWRKHFSSFSY